jgi:hypothetical protein
MIAREFVLALSAAVALSAPATRAEQPSYDLRALLVWTGPNPAEQSVSQANYFDTFANGDPLLGVGYANGVSGTGTYTSIGSPGPGTETAAASTDYFGDKFGVGRMRFRFADSAAVPTHLDLPGTVNMRESLILNPMPTPLLSSDHSFSIVTAWDFTTPGSGSTYGSRLSDNTSQVLDPTLPFNDLIDLRVLRSGAGRPIVAVRRVSWDGSVISISDGAAMDPAQVLPAGHTLDEVAIIDLELTYDAAPGQTTRTVQASFWMAGAQEEDLGGYTFPMGLAIFRGESTTQVAATANWTAAVPEPATWMLLLGGLAAVGEAVRRRPHHT